MSKGKASRGTIDADFPLLPLDLAFVIQDPCSIHAVELAREVFRLIEDRTDDQCVAIACELRALSFKYGKKVNL